MNRAFFYLGLRGMGFGNYKNDSESGELNFLSKYIAKYPNGIVFDVGANVGIYASRLRELNTSLNIYCFEPHPITFKRLSNNVSKLHVNIFNLAVGATNDFLTLYDYSDNDGSEHASLYRNVIKDIHHGSITEHVVQAISLDSFVQDHSINKILLLKIDAEGNEFDVLEGFKNFINFNRIEFIQFEFNEMNVISRKFFKDFWDLLPNYDFYRLLRGNLIPIKSYDPVTCEIFWFNNMVARLQPEFSSL
jgi:FkbM family methyltransferase